MEARFKTIERKKFHQNDLQKTFDGSCTKHPVSMHLNTLLTSVSNNSLDTNDPTARKEFEFASRVACTRFDS